MIEIIEMEDFNMEEKEKKFVKLSVEAASVDLVMSKEREKEIEKKLKEYKKEHKSQERI